MKAKIVVTEDTVSEYFKRVTESMKAEQNNMLYDMADILTEDISEVMPIEGGALMESGFDEKTWVITKTNHMNIISVLYSGEGSNYSWREFREDEDTTKPPERDYAFFQETGKDKTAKPEHARRKGFISNTLQNGVTHEQINKVAVNYLKRIFSNG